VIKIRLEFLQEFPEMKLNTKGNVISQKLQLSAKRNNVTLNLDTNDIRTDNSPVTEIRLEFLQEFPASVHRLVTVTALSRRKRLISGFGERGCVQGERRACGLSCGSTPASNTSMMCGASKSHTYPKQFSTRQHTLFQTCIQKIDMIPQELIHSSSIGQFRL
jgi:hypothetical protein